MAKTKPRVNKSRTDNKARINMNTIVLPDYKVPATLSKFINGRGMILPAKTTKISAKIQRKVATEIERARFMALIPYTYRHKI